MGNPSSEEGLAVRSGREAEPAGDTLSYIREGRPNANGSGGQAWGKGHNRHLFAGVIGAAPGGIVAVIRSEHDEIVGTQRGDQFGQPLVKGFKGLRIARDVA